MKDSFDKQVVKNAEAARAALYTFLETPGALFETLGVSRDLIYTCSEASKKLGLFLEKRKSDPEAEVE